MLKNKRNNKQFPIIGAKFGIESDYNTKKK